jgi:hypothetical protein
MQAIAAALPSPDHKSPGQAARDVQDEAGEETQDPGE